MIVVGTKNPVKLAALYTMTDRFNHLRDHEVIPFDVPSFVSEQPTSLEETIGGALNRASRAYDEAVSRHLRPLFAVGIESGVFEIRPTRHDKPRSTFTFDVCACAVLRPHPITSSDPMGSRDVVVGEVLLQHVGLSRGWEVPPSVARWIYVDGLDMDQAFLEAELTEKSDLGTEEGAIGVLSGGRVDRQRCIEDAVELAFLGSEKPEERWTIYR